MNIPADVARAQGAHGSEGAAHGILGAVHGIKGGRPRLALTDYERAQRRRDQQQAYRRRKGIMPREVLTREEREERNKRERDGRFNKEYRRVWRKLPGVPLTAGEFAKRYVAFRRWVRGCRDRRCPLHQAVHFVRTHWREERRRQREEEYQRLDVDEEEEHERADEWKIRVQLKQQAPQSWDPPLAPPAATPSVGRNQPCPCGSDRKFKKCCGP